MASAKPATVPVGSATGGSETANDRAAGAQRHDDVAGPQARPSAAPMLSPVPGATATPDAVSPDRLGRRRRPAARPIARPKPSSSRSSAVLALSPATSSRCRTRRRGRWSAVAGSAGAAGAVSQSCGSSTLAARGGAVRLVAASQRSLVTVKLATGTSPMRVGPRLRRRPARRSGRRPPPPSGCRSTAAPGAPPRRRRRAAPCRAAGPPTAIAATPSSSPGAGLARTPSHQCAGSTSVPSGCGGAAARARPAGVGVARPAPCVDWVDESTPATRVMRESCPPQRGVRDGAMPCPQARPVPDAIHNVRFVPRELRREPPWS